MKADFRDMTNLSINEKKALELEKSTSVLTLIPETSVPLIALPLTPKGQIDEQALTQIEVIESKLVQQWEEKLRSLPEVKELAIVIQEQVESLQPLHLSDLLPVWKVDEMGDINQSIATSGKTTLLQQNSENKQLANSSC